MTLEQMIEQAWGIALSSRSKQSHTRFKKHIETWSKLMMADCLARGAEMIRELAEEKLAAELDKGD